MQNFGQISRFLWAKLWTYGQYRGQDLSLVYEIWHPLWEYQNNYSKEEEQKFTQVFGKLTSEFAAKMAEGVHASDESVQELVKQHYDFVLQFWTPDKEAYKSLAMTYILPSQYRDSYEEVAQGLGKYHYDAVCIWADKNL